MALHGERPGPRPPHIDKCLLPPGQEAHITTCYVCQVQFGCRRFHSEIPTISKEQLVQYLAQTSPRRAVARHTLTL